MKQTAAKAVWIMPWGFSHGGGLSNNILPATLAVEHVRGDPPYSKIFIEFLLSAMPLYLTVNTACGEPLEIIYRFSNGRRRFSADVDKKKESGEIWKRYSLLCAC